MSKKAHTPLPGHYSDNRVLLYLLYYAGGGRHQLGYSHSSAEELYTLLRQVVYKQVSNALLKTSTEAKLHTCIRITIKNQHTSTVSQIHAKIT